MADTPEEYLANAPAVARPWLEELWDYVQTTYPGQKLTMFRGVPMFKLGGPYTDGYVMFTAARRHFAAHAVDFDLVERTRAAIPGAKGGKGSVAVKYKQEEAKPVLRRFVDLVMARHGIDPIIVR